jgi:GNAT superfamily N-acetyltransferase
MTRVARAPAFTLPNGAHVRIRPIKPSDAPELRRAFHALSPTSRYFRFLSEMRELNDDALQYLTDVDGDSHIAYVALLESPDLKNENIVGVARAIRLKDDPDVAEAAVTIADDLQHLGLGRHMLRVLVEAARAKGIRGFRAEVLASNAPVRAAFESAKIKPIATEDEMLVYEVPLDAAENTESPLQNFLHAAASSLSEVLRSLRSKT